MPFRIRKLLNRMPCSYQWFERSVPRSRKLPSAMESQEHRNAQGATTGLPAQCSSQAQGHGAATTFLSHFNPHEGKAAELSMLYSLSTYGNTCLLSTPLIFKHESTLKSSWKVINKIILVKNLKPCSFFS